jgi:hypothetical protein
LRSNRILSLSPLLLTLALGGCDSPMGDDAALRVPEEQGVRGEHGGSIPPVSTVTPLADGVYRFTSTAILDVPQGAAWAKIHDIETLLAIVLPSATDFQWLDGGGSSRVPSRYQFNALGSTVVEEVYRQDHAEKVLGYRLVIPALGIQTYDATVALDPLDNDHTIVTYTRDMTFDDPASVAAFAALFEQEVGALHAYFADKPR